MTLEPGTRFGSYDVAESIGSGGMGEVWRATDTSLKRDVALKVLPEAFVQDADRLARFQREAEILASLNHPNIAQVYGLEKSEGQTAIVMELVEGPTLADRIEHGPIAPDEAMSIALQVIGALEAAHDKGIVHRDLKPANVKVRDDGTVKVLDFGISKPIDPSIISGGSPVATTPAVTQTGVILGTAAYMSPEQARGRFVDQRTDIWAFGCLLFEMLTGQPAFGGEDVMATLARVIDRDTDLSSVPKSISPAVRHTIKLCLEKDPRKRIADVRDVRLALEGKFESEPSGAAEPGSVAKPSLWRRTLPFAAAVAIAGLIILTAGRVFETAAAPEVVRLLHSIPDGQLLSPVLGAPVVDISPDGREFVYSTDSGIMRRRLDELEARLIPGTEEQQAIGPRYSPGGEFVTFVSVADEELKRIGIEGGTPLPISASLDVTGWAWTDDGTLYLAQGGRILHISADGDPIEVLLEDPDAEFRSPRLLPGGGALIMEYGRIDNDSPTEIAVLSLESRQLEPLFPGLQPQYLDPGYLVYADPALGLMARAFDPETFGYGGPALLADNVYQLDTSTVPLARVGASGSLVYVRGAFEQRGANLRLARLHNDGTTETLDPPADQYRWPRVAPDASRLAVQIGVIEEAQIFLYDLSGDSELSQFTFDGASMHPSWAADGAWITFSSNRDGRWRIYRKRADGTGAAEPLTDPAEGFGHFAPVWAPDGRLTYAEEDLSSGEVDTYIVAIPDGTPEVFLGSEGDQFMVDFAPNGELFAYVSQTTGVAEVLVETFPRTGRVTRVSEQGVATLGPVWSSVGMQLSFWLSGTGFGTVEFDAGSFLVRGRRVLLPELLPSSVMIDAIPESDSWLVIVSPSRDGASEIVVVTNWIEEVKAAVPPIER